ncbi:MAG: hypothetical protein M1582_01385, partial [Actinobacteria bacterium]|nr:hypothetical protein [Actinomycetota bacterium]
MRTLELEQSEVHPTGMGWRQSLLTAFAWVAGVRVFLTLYMAAAFFMFPRPVLHELYDGTGVNLLDSGWQGALLGVWQREDALWYEKIATVGYSTTDGTQDRFPLLPVLMSLLSHATGMHPVAAALIVSDLSLLLALFLLHRLLLAKFDAGVANRTLAYISLFPMAFFLHGPFGESLMLALALLAFYLVARGYWVAAIPVAYLAGLTRPQGMLLGIALAAQIACMGKPLLTWRPSWWKRGLLFPTGYLFTAPLLGLATFALSVDTAWRGPFATGKRGLWASQSVLVPGTALLYAGQRIMAGSGHPRDLHDFACALLFLALSAIALFKLDAGWAVYSALFLLAPLSRYSPTFPLMSMSRYVLVLFPCFVILALWGRKKWVHMSILFVWMCGL